MIISRGRRYIFVHAPKTGGTSLTLALEDRAKKDDILISDTPKGMRRRKRLDGVTTAGRLWKHSTLANVEGLITLDEIRSSFVFTLIRNPWDRLVSYYHWAREQTFLHWSVTLAQQSPFETFALDERIGAMFRKRPPSHYVMAADGREYCNLFIRLEHFRDDAAALEAHLGFAVDMPVENTSDRPRDYRPFYTDSLAQHVAGMFPEEVTRFGYLFDS